MEFRKLGIVGGGHMGKSIAEKVASNGIDVVVLEVSEERAKAAARDLALILDAELAKWGITASEKKVVLSRVRFVTDIAPDGSPVAFYRRLPATGEPELIHAVIAPGAMRSITARTSRSDSKISSKRRMTRAATSPFLWVFMRASSRS